MEKFILSIGLNDKDSKSQKMNVKNALNTIANISNEYTDGATIYATKGVYKHENGQKVVENGFRAEYYGAQYETVLQVARLIKKALNQEAIYLEKVTTNSELI